MTWKRRSSVICVCSDPYIDTSNYTDDYISLSTFFPKPLEAFLLEASVLEASVLDDSVLEVFGKM